MSIPAPASTFESFSDAIALEFIRGSSISPDLYNAAVSIVSDIEILPGRDVDTPIHNALNWRYTRFGAYTQPTLFAALLTNEDGSTWQAKLSAPRMGEKGKAQKYETPVGNGSRAFLPAVTLGSFRAIAKRYNLPEAEPWLRVKSPYSIKVVEALHQIEVMEMLDHDSLKSAATFLVPLLGLTEMVLDAGLEAIVKAMPDNTLVPQFWDYVNEHQEIPIVWTEGGKKSLSLLSHGYVAIALYGVNGGYRKQLDDSRVLIPDVERFCQPERLHVLAFDQDSQTDTQRRVNVALARYGGLIEATGGNVTVAIWESRKGKGVDDLIVGSGASAFDKAYTDALSLTHWRIYQRLHNRLTIPAQVRVIASDLSSLELALLPESGIIGLISAKGTGKTKFIKSVVEAEDKVLSGTHRIALGRNLCSRLGLNWRGDLDKVKGEFISDSGYTLRVGFCVDSLLAIDPEKFRGCDLVLDEVVQVVRHLITSSTCARDGKRPALLSRFRELIQVARRVIVADADLDNATLFYLKELRQSEENEDQPIFLIRNDYRSDGFAVSFIDSPDRTAVASHLLNSVEELEEGKVIFVATDSKATSKVLASIVEKEFPEKRILTINSETSGGELERAFMEAPDKALTEHLYDVIICSPSMATGVSIEVQGIITKVYGVFTGVSATDADMAQALARVREPVERVVWCAIAGTNYSKVSRSTNFLEVKDLLQQTTAATVRLIRDGLDEETARGVEAYDYQSNPHVNLFCRMSADHNFSMWHLRDALYVRLKMEGNQVDVFACNSHPEIKLMLSEIRQEQKSMDAETLVGANDLTIKEILALEQKEVTSPEEQRSVAKYYFKEFYGLEQISVEDVLWDNEGRRRSEILHLEMLLYPHLSVERTIHALQKQTVWGRGICPWDIPTLELRRTILERLGMGELLGKIINGWEWTKYDLIPYAALARKFSQQVKHVLHFTISDAVSDVQIIHQLLTYLGVRVEQKCWSRSVAGFEGEKLRVYTLCVDHWKIVKGILDRRMTKRESYEEPGSPRQYREFKQQGDPEESTRLEGYLAVLTEAFRQGEESLLDVWIKVSASIAEEALKLHLLRRLPQPIYELVTA